MRFAHLSKAVAGLPEGRIGVAVSGGGDSLALLLLLHDAGYDLAACTVDHGLRDESADEANGVRDLCSHHNIPHTTLCWQHGDIAGNLQDAAREARRRLIAGWAKANDIGHVALGHTMDDQAETLLMRLARGSGVDGLAGIVPVTHRDGLVWHRPLLTVGRTDLRAFLRDRGVIWVDDPSNDDPRFDRIKARKALDLLAGLGIDRARLAATADHMQRARQALEQATYALAADCCTVGRAGDVSIDTSVFRVATPEVQLRLIAAALRWVASARYRPRFASLSSILDEITAGNDFTRTLHGCFLHAKAGSLAIGREVSATQPQPAGGIWDGRWHVSGPFQGDETVRALDDEGLQQCPEWRDGGLNRRTLLPSPSIWRNNSLIAAPLANMANGWETTLTGGQNSFFDSLIPLKHR